MATPAPTCDHCGRRSPDVQRSQRYTGRNGRSIWTCHHCEQRPRPRANETALNRAGRPRWPAAYAAITLTVLIATDAHLKTVTPRLLLAELIGFALSVYLAVRVVAPAKTHWRRRQAVKTARQRVRPPARHAPRHARAGQ